MKLTKEQLKKIIKEELSHIVENEDRRVYLGYPNPEMQEHIVDHLTKALNELDLRWDNDDVNASISAALDQLKEMYPRKVTAERLRRQMKN